MDRKTPKHLTWILRSAVAMGGLTLAACAPMALPGEGNQPAAAQAIAALETTATVEVTNTASPSETSTIEVTNTAVPSETSTAEVTNTAVPSETSTPEMTSTPMPSETSVTPTPVMTTTVVAGQHVEFIGTIESFDGGVLMVSGRKVVITAQTEVKFQPQKGLNVKVEGTLQADGSILASEIKSVPAGLATHKPDMTRTPRPDETREPRPTHAANETEFTGVVASINGSTYVVNGITVVAVGEVKGTIVVGDTVKVHGALQSDGTVLAREIEKVGSDDGSHDGQGDDDGHDGHGSDDGGHEGHGGHGGDDVTPTPAPTSVDGTTPTPAPTSDDTVTPTPAGGDDHGGHGGDDSGDGHGGHGGDDKP